MFCLFSCYDPCHANVVLADGWRDLMTAGIVNDRPTSLTLINFLTLSRLIEGQTYVTQLFCVSLAASLHLVIQS